MGFSIEIIEGQDPSSYFWFVPVTIENTDKIEWDGVSGNESEKGFSIEEGDVESFLYYFLEKYFDDMSIYNRNRYDTDEYISGFEWYLTHNFYTYDVLEKMIEDILYTAKLLEVDYDNPYLDDVKKRYNTFYMCKTESEDYDKNDAATIKKHISVVIDFYNLFVERLRIMMENNTDTNIISIMGP